MEFCSPTQEEFCRLAQKGNLIPVTRRLLADQETPLTAYRKLRDRGESFLFESVEGGEHLAPGSSSAAASFFPNLKPEGRVVLSLRDS